MFRAWLSPTVVGLVLVACVIEPALGAKKPTYSRSNKNSSANRAQSAANQARQAVSNAQRQLAEARQQAVAADNRADRQSYETERIREEVRKEHDSAPGLQTVRRMANESRSQFEELRKPVLEQLARTRPYQDAVAERNRLTERLQAMPSTQTEQRSQLEHEYALANVRVHQLEKEALEADPALRKAKESLDIDERDVREQVRRRDAEIAQDSRLNAAQSEVSQARAAADAAKDRVAQEARQLVKAQQNYAQKTLAVKRVQTQKRNTSSKRRR